MSNYYQYAKELFVQGNYKDFEELVTKQQQDYQLELYRKPISKPSVFFNFAYEALLNGDLVLLQSMYAEKYLLSEDLISLAKIKYARIGSNVKRQTSYNYQFFLSFIKFISGIKTHQSTDHLVQLDDLKKLLQLLGKKSSLITEFLESSTEAIPKENGPIKSAIKILPENISGPTPEILAQPIDLSILDKPSSYLNFVTEFLYAEQLGEDLDDIVDSFPNINSHYENLTYDDKKTIFLHVCASGNENIAQYMIEREGPEFFNTSTGRHNLFDKGCHLGICTPYFISKAFGQDKIVRLLERYDFDLF